MDIHKFKIFLDLASTLNYSETAERLFTTQGNISKQIQGLEKELNVSLFTRAHRKIELSNAGEMVLPYARKIMNDFESLNVKLSDYHEQQELTLDLFTIPTMNNYVSFKILSKFMNEHPEVKISMQEKESDDLFDLLRQNKCDLIFARTFDFSEQQLERIVMETDDLVVVLPKSDELATENVISVKELSKRQFLQLGNATQLLQPVIETCQRAGFTPNITYQGVRVDLIIGMIKQHMGISIMMKKTAEGYIGTDLVAIPLEENIPSQLSFIRKKGHISKAGNVFWNFVKNYQKQ